MYCDCKSFNVKFVPRTIFFLKSFDVKFVPRTVFLNSNTFHDILKIRYSSENYYLRLNY